MRFPAWINLYDGVPPASLFTTTMGQGTPVVIDINTGIPYYLSATNVVTPFGGGGSGNFIPLVDGSEPPNFITDGAGTLILVPWSA